MLRLRRSRSAPPPHRAPRFAPWLAAGVLVLLAAAPAAAREAGAPAPEASPPAAESAAGPAAQAAAGQRDAGDGEAARRFRLADPAPRRSPWAPREWALSAGVFDLAESDRAEAGLELRFASWTVRLFERDWRIEPVLFGMVNEDGGWYGHLGVRVPIELGERWRVAPYFGPGVYSAGDGLDLGGPVEFRSGLEVSARLGERVGLGVSYYHLSNGILYDLNPGQESLVLVLAVRPGAGR